MNKRINLVLFKRYSNQLWYLNRHVHAYVKMDELAKFDRNADRLENEVEKAILWITIALLAIRRRPLLTVSVLKPLVYAWTMVIQQIL